MKRLSLASLTLIACLFVGVFAAGVARSVSPPPSTCKTTEAFCFAPQLGETPHRIESATVPKIATPSWLSEQQQPAAREVTYVIASKGAIHADLAEFADVVNQTLNSPQGWSRLGVRFVRVESDGQFTAWLTESSQVPAFSASGCDTVVSCTVGNNVIINETRWLNGADSWNAAGGSLADYRRMVINHETGHWLGHGHEYCAGAGQPAPVMQQQTIDMQSCAPNPWPLPNELYSPKLGIRS